MDTYFIEREETVTDSAGRKSYVTVIKEATYGTLVAIQNARGQKETRHNPDTETNGLRPLADWRQSNGPSTPEEFYKTRFLHKATELAFMKKFGIGVDPVAIQPSQPQPQNTGLKIPESVLQAMKKDDLLELATSNGIEAKPVMKKEDIISLITGEEPKPTENA